MEHNYCQLGLAVIETEAKAVLDLSARLDETFDQACQHMLDCQGRIVVMGMGKSGHISHKIAATLASTGSPAFFVHPGEANHGDMGMITANDVVLAISNSGRTEEILRLLPMIKRLGVPLISLSGDPNSTLARAATVNIDISVSEEACPLGLAPTSSTTASLVMGDALAVALLKARGFTAEDFALSHPGGKLGKRLLLKVGSIMHSENEVPVVDEHTNLSESLIEVTQKKLGMTCVVNQKHELLGIFTDGDLRRALDKNIDIHSTPIKDVMTQAPKTIQADLLAVEALSMMENNKITALIIVDDSQRPVGVIHMHDLLSAGVI